MNYSESKLAQANAGGTAAGIKRNAAGVNSKISPSGGSSHGGSGAGEARKRKSTFRQRKGLSQGVNRKQADAKGRLELKTAKDDVIKIKRQMEILEKQFEKKIHLPFAGYAGPSGHTGYG